MTATENTSRRARRAQQKGAADTEGIKDRNKKLRDEAADKRRKRRSAQRGGPSVEGLDAGERVDDALVRGADATSRFVRKHFAWMQWLVVLTIVGAMALLIYNFRLNRERQKAGGELAQALHASMGRIATSTPITPSDPNLVDPRPEFPSEEARTENALQKWEDLAKRDEPELRLIGKLGKAGVLYEARKFEEAKIAYSAVVDDPVASRFETLREQALEGIGLSLEAAKKPDEALKAFARLQNEPGDYAKRLARFHEARVRFTKGERDKALSILEKLDEELSKAGSEGPTTYLEAAVQDLLKTVDPSKIEQAPQGIDPEQLERLKKQLEAMQAQNPSGAPPEGIPMPRPEEDPEEGSAQPTEPSDTPSAEDTPPKQAAPPKTPPAKAPSPVPSAPKNAPGSSQPSPSPQAPAPTPQPPATNTAPTPQPPATSPQPAPGSAETE